MHVADALNSRYSARAFRADPLSPEILMQIMKAANRTPSWANTQPWEIFIAGGEPLNRLRQAFLQRHQEGLPLQPELPWPPQFPADLHQRMADTAALRFDDLGIDRQDRAARLANYRNNFKFFEAPVVVYLCLERSLSPWSIFDMGLIAQSIMLAAWEAGVDSIPAVTLVAYPDLIRTELNIPDNLMILFGMALGYADSKHPLNQPRSPRRPVADIVRICGLE